MDLKEIERHLDAGNLGVRLVNGKAWRARRNGKTVTWKTRPGEFRIPVKFGFKHCGQITHDNFDEAMVILDRTMTD